MAQGFYTLEEAANLLGLAPDELNRMAQQRQVRAFADRGTWRFRSQDIDEMVRQGGLGGDPNPPAGDESPAPAPRTSGVATSPADGDDLIPFDEPLDLNPGSGINHPKTDEDLIPFDDLDNPPPLDIPPTVGTGTSAVNLGDDLALSPSGSQAKSPSKASTLKPGADSDVRLVLDEGSSEFELAMDSSPALQEQAAEAPPASAPRITAGPVLPESDPGLDLGPAPVSALDSDPDPGLGLDLSETSPALDEPPPVDEHDSDVRVDFDSSTLDDSMVSMGGPRPDSDVRLEQAGPSQVPIDAGMPPVESMATEEIDLDAELQQADLASQARRGKTKPVGARTPLPPGPTQLPSAPKGTMLPTSSPFELSEDDLEFSGTGDSNVNRPLGSEFELTLAPEDETSPLNLGDDEDVDLGGLPPKDGMSSSARAELSGINLHDPADSGISLEKGGASDSVDFELTVDDDAAGPKTIKGKIPDSDSEFELTLEDDSGESLPPLEGDDSSSSGDQKDIFETDFNLPALEGEDSRSEAVALDGSDTDLESSDFDLAVSDTDLEKHAAIGDESGSEVVVLGEDDEPAPKKKSRVTGGSLDSVDELLLDDDGLEVEDSDDDELTPAAPTIPAAEAEWGMFPILILVPCVLLMFLAGLMSYELLHGMWGYHAASKPSGLVVRGIAGLFTEDLPKE